MQYLKRNEIHIQHPTYVNTAEIIVLGYDYDNLTEPTWINPHLTRDTIIHSDQYQLTAYKSGEYNIYFTAKDENHCTLADTITILDSIPTGIVTYPSPNNGNFIVETAIFFNTISISLFDIKRKAVYETSMYTGLPTKKLPISINKSLIDDNYLLHVKKMRTTNTGIRYQYKKKHVIKKIEFDLSNFCNNMINFSESSYNQGYCPGRL